MFDVWMRILHAVDRSVLWLFEDNSLATENLKKEAEKRGVSAERLIFSKHIPLSEHLARQAQADLFLDTFPCNAHTTASDALWVGLPVLTLSGESFASRVAASLLSAVDLSELIVQTVADYELMAITLANQPQKIDTIRQKLLTMRQIAPLFDTPNFTRDLESSYIKIYERYQENLHPQHTLV
jgi:hypothetical protein